MFHVHYHWIGQEVVVDHSPYAGLELARAEANRFNATHNAITEAYAVVVRH